MALSLSANVGANKTTLAKYFALPQGERTQALYIWIDGTGEGLRAKTKSLDQAPKSIEGTFFYTACPPGLKQVVCQAYAQVKIFKKLAFRIANLEFRWVQHVPSGGLELGHLPVSSHDVQGSIPRRKQQISSLRNL